MVEFLSPLRAVFEWVGAFESSIALRESQYVWALVLTTHVIFLCGFAGLITMMDLRLLGIGNMGTPFSQLQRWLFPWQMVTMAGSSITGLVLVFSDPMRFWVSIFFWVKMGTMALAAVNAMAFHFISYERIAEWDTSPVPPLGARLAGGLGMLLWANIIVNGRLIPYNWFL
jgi:hypothetical protein